MQIAYTIQLGTHSLSSRGASGAALLALEVERGIGGAGGRCDLRLASAAGVRPAAGDPLRIGLDVGRGPQTVFTGEIEAIHCGAEAWTVRGRDGMGRLATLELHRSYEEVSAGFIVKDLVDAAGAEAGELDEGPSFPRYLLHDGPKALRHAQRLGALVGADLYTDGDGRIHFRRPRKQPVRHRLRWSESVLDLELVDREPLGDSLEVWGEGAAGTEGAEREHWLTTDLTGVRGQVALEHGAGASNVMVGRLAERPRLMVDGAIRSVDAAEDIAAALMEAQALRPHAGAVLLPGLVDVEPGDWVELDELPAELCPTPSASLTVRVRRLWHFLSPSQGLLTRLGF